MAPFWSSFASVTLHCLAAENEKAACSWEKLVSESPREGISRKRGDGTVDAV